MWSAMKRGPCAKDSLATTIGPHLKLMLKTRGASLSTMLFFLTTLKVIIFMFVQRGPFNHSSLVEKVTSKNNKCKDTLK